MNDYQQRIEKIKNIYRPMADERFERAMKGTHHVVYISPNYVIRFRDGDPSLLAREATFLKILDNSLIPKTLWSDESFSAMIETRLPGVTLDTAWKNFNEDQKDQFVAQMISFLRYLRGLRAEKVYSVHSGIYYSDFFELLTDGLAEKISVVQRFKQTSQVLKDITTIINAPTSRTLFVKSKHYTIVHGDLIIHNLLIKNGSLTGVLDWELALSGDSDYDIFRLFYYQECAQAYHEQEVDDTFEADYMDRLVEEIRGSNLISDKIAFQQKYKVVRALFYLNALSWAAQSAQSEENIKENVNLWEKNKKEATF